MYKHHTMDTIQQIANKLNAAGLKITPQRIAVLQTLAVSVSHPTAEEIHKQVLQSLPGLSPTTVYNVLDALVGKNLVNRVKTDAGVMRYDAVTHNHHHLYDENSDHMEDYHDPELDKLLTDYFERKKIKGFRLKDVKLQLTGEFQKESIK